MNFDQLSNKTNINICCEIVRWLDQGRTKSGLSVISRDLVNVWGIDSRWRNTVAKYCQDIGIPLEERFCKARVNYRIECAFHFSKKAVSLVACEKLSFDIAHVFHAMEVLTVNKLSKNDINLSQFIEILARGPDAMDNISMCADTLKTLAHHNEDFREIIKEGNLLNVLLNKLETVKTGWLMKGKAHQSLTELRNEIYRNPLSNYSKETKSTGIIASIFMSINEFSIDIRLIILGLVLAIATFFAAYTLIHRMG